MVRGRRRRTKAKPLNGLAVLENEHSNHKSPATKLIDYTLDSEKSPSIKKYFKPECKKETNNIFLQEPVLKLDVLDCPTNEASKSLMKHSFHDLSNNDAFANISKGLITIGPDNENVCKLLIEEKIIQNTKNCSPSSPNGAAVINQNKGKKSTTPHRILCPSPDKSISRVDVNLETFRTRLDQKFSCQEATKEPSDNVGTSDENKILNSTDGPTAQQNGKIDKPKVTGTNPKLTEYFTVRRSVRKTKKEVQNEILRSYEQAVLLQQENGLEIRVFGNKGRGVVATRNFSKGEFVVEYVGDLISITEANKREFKYAKDDNTGCYMYYFKYNDQQYCIDATEESGRLGRLVNHCRNGNLTTKTVSVCKDPHLVLIAKHDIKKGEELTYDYGDRSKESLAHHPWLAF